MLICFEKFNPFRVFASLPVISHGINPRLLLFNPFMVVTHGLFNGTMRLTQGGKFEHGFMSGFVSSLGGSYMMGIDNKVVQVAMSAAIVGTAEAMGGGKFANGAVTGAYVMMFNHMGGKLSQRGLERRIQRRFQQNAMNDPDLKNYPVFKHVNGETIKTESGNEYILYDNKWLDLPKWETKEITYSPVSDGGEGVGVTYNISRETYIRQLYIRTNLEYVRWKFTIFDLSLNPGEFIFNVISGGFQNMMEAEHMMYLRMEIHDSHVRYNRNNGQP